MLKKRDALEPCYSGDASTEFWSRVNALPEPISAEVYACGVLLQNLEQTVLAWLNNAEVVAGTAKPRKVRQKS